MTLWPQILTAIAIWFVLLGSFFSPELSKYAAQIVALLLVFYIVLQHIRQRQTKQEIKEAVKDEDTLLFLTTYIKPKLASVIELSAYEENRLLVEKQLEMIYSELQQFVEDKEKEVSQ